MILKLVGIIGIVILWEAVGIAIMGLLLSENDRPIWLKMIIAFTWPCYLLGLGLQEVMSDLWDFVKSYLEY